jgi:hypothetical protein
VKITKSLLTVKWEDGSTELFGRAGQEFYGNADESGEALKPRGDKQIWGTDEDSHLTIPTEHAKQSLAEKRKKSAELRVERETAESCHHSRVHRRWLAAFALLTALASYQMDDSIVASFRRLRPKDDEMVSAAAWAAFAAARRVGSWLAPSAAGA